MKSVYLIVDDDNRYGLSVGVFSTLEKADGKFRELLADKWPDDDEEDETGQTFEECFDDGAFVYGGTCVRLVEIAVDSEDMEHV